MSLGRTIGYVGIALLLALMLFGFAIAWTNRDFYGLLLMAGFACLIAFFTYGLVSAARREANPDLARNSGLGWYGESVTAFILGPVLHTPQGWVVVIGSIAAV